MKLSAILLSTVAAGTLFAANVSQSTDGLGDFLIAPVYIAKGDVCSKVTVYNTNTKNSILAKVTFREQIASNEVDFPIFLSPGDVWSGEVCQKNGDVVLYSKDDSNHPKIAKILATGKSLPAQSKAAGNKNVDFTTGYVEVYPIAEFKEKGEKKINKDILVKRWDMLISGKYPCNTLKGGVDGYSLSGSVSFETAGDVTTTLPMVAFKGAHDKTLTGSSIAYGNDTGPDILLGTDKKVQLLKLTQHSKAMFTYSNFGKNQYVVFTYPFGYAKTQIRKYKVTVRDMSENKDNKPKEVIIFSPAPKIKKKNNFMKNEVAVLSVADIIAKTKNPSMFKAGQIQIEDITNVTDVQLGAGKKASFIATYVTFGNNGKATYVNTASYVPVK
ncbi:MAG: hypothetical protein GXO62_06625 [Epsilonproteobacteria bacterium]|nr:hypothetical protein [Campylobacterota bacterium]